MTISTRAQDPNTLKPQGYVNDFANVLSPAARTQLTDLCAEVDLKTQAQIAVVTVKSLNGQSAFAYSLALAMHWGVGPKQKDRGVMILVSVGDHQYFTQVGYGLEGILPDGKVGGFGREAVPLLRQNNYDAALLLITRRVADVIAADRGVKLSGEPLPAARDLQPKVREGVHSAEITLIILVVLFVIIGRAISGASSRQFRGRYRGGGWWIGPMMGGWGGGGFGGGGWGGSGWSGGSGGGFGGFGGGSFGGGGAGGSW